MNVFFCRVVMWIKMGQYNKYISIHSSSPNSVWHTEGTNRCLPLFLPLLFIIIIIITIIIYYHHYLLLALLSIIIITIVRNSLWEGWWTRPLSQKPLCLAPRVNLFLFHLFCCQGTLIPKWFLIPMWEFPDLGAWACRWGHKMIRNHSGLMSTLPSPTMPPPLRMHGLLWVWLTLNSFQIGWGFPT